MSELTKEFITSTIEKLEEYEVPPVTSAQLTRDAFMYGRPLVPLDEPSYVFFYIVPSRAEQTRDWFMYGVGKEVVDV